MVTDKVKEELPAISDSERNAKSVGMSDVDQAMLKAAGDAWGVAYRANDQAGMDAAHAAAENIRKKYGYSGGEDGSQKVEVHPSSSGNYDLSEHIKQQYAAQTEAELAQLKSAYETSLKGYDDAAARLPEVYQQARNTVAGQNAQEKRAFDERAAAAGLNSGANGQAQLAMSSAYLSQLGGLDREQSQKQSEIDLERAKLQSEYQAAISEAQARGEAELASALYQELLRVQTIEREAAERAEAQRREDELRAAEWERQDKLRAAEQEREEAMLAAKLAREEQLYARELALELGVTDPAALSQITGLTDLVGLTAAQPETTPTPTPTQSPVTALTPKQIETVFGVDAPYTEAGAIGQIGGVGGTSGQVGAVESTAQEPAAETSHLGTRFAEASSWAQQRQRSGISEQEVGDYLNSFSETELTDAGLRYILSHMNMYGYGR